MNKQRIFFSFYKTIMRSFGGKGLRKYPLVYRIKQFILSQAKSDVAKIHGDTMYLGPKDSLELSIYPEYESLEYNFVKEKIKKGDVILDVGANIGYYTISCAKIVGNTGKIFSFEPEPENFKLLEKNVKVNHYDNVVLNNVAVSDKNGTVNLYLSKIRGGMHRIYPSHFCTEDYVKTNLICLDDYFSTNPLREKISFVKIDVEGSELGVLKGMKTILPNKRLIILLEFVPGCLKEFGSDPKDVIELLRSYNFQFYYTLEEKREIHKIDNFKLFLHKYDGDKNDKSPKGTNIICIK